MNMYRLTNVATNEVITGNTRDLDFRFGSDRLRECIHRNKLLDGVWKVEKLGTVKRNAAAGIQKESPLKKMTIDEIDREALRCGMTYGKYVTIMER